MGDWRFYFHLTSPFEYLKGFNFTAYFAEDPENQTIFSSEAEFNIRDDAEAFCSKFDGVAGVTATYDDISFEDYDGYIEQYWAEVTVDIAETDFEEFRKAYGAFSDEYPLPRQ